MTILLILYEFQATKITNKMIYNHTAKLLSDAYKIILLL